MVLDEGVRRIEDESGVVIFVEGDEEIVVLLLSLGEEEGVEGSVEIHL